MVEPQPSAAFSWIRPSSSVGPALQCAPLGAIAGHLFTAGHLQLRGDPDEWQAAASVLSARSSDLRLVKQVHRAEVAIARRGDAVAWVTPEADVVVSDDPDVVHWGAGGRLRPILIADPKRRAVGAVHAGWRGAVQRAAAAGIAALSREFGSDPADLVAAIGPCLGVCCGEIGEDVVQAFRDAGHSQRTVERWVTIGPGGRFHLRLAESNRDQLESAGLRPENIHVADLCTRSFPDVFHSFRAAGPNAGRMAALIRCR